LASFSSSNLVSKTDFTLEGPYLSATNASGMLALGAFILSRGVGAATGFLASATGAATTGFLASATGAATGFLASTTGAATGFLASATGSGTASFDTILTILSVAFEVDSSSLLKSEGRSPIG